MEKKYITMSRLVDDSKPGASMFGLGIFAIIGIGIVIVTGFNYLMNPVTNNLITFLVLSGIFGIPFGYFIGLRNILNMIKDQNKIRNGEFKIVKDIITNKNTSQVGDERTKYYVSLKYFSDAMERKIKVTSAEYKEARVGEPCYLVFLMNDKRSKGYPALTYMGRSYELTPDLEKYLTTDIEQFVVV